MSTRCDDADDASPRGRRASRVARHTSRPKRRSQSSRLVRTSARRGAPSHEGARAIPRDGRATVARLSRAAPLSPTLPVGPQPARGSRTHHRWDQPHNPARQGGAPAVARRRSANGLGAANEDAPMSPSPLVVGRGRRGRRWLRRSGDRRAAAPRRGRALPPARRARAARRPCRRPARACAARGARPAVPYRRRPDRARARAGELRTAPRATSAEAVGLGRGAAPAPRTAYARLLDTQNTISQGSFVFF